MIRNPVLSVLDVIWKGKIIPIIVLEMDCHLGPTRANYVPRFLLYSSCSCHRPRLHHLRKERRVVQNDISTVEYKILFLSRFIVQEYYRTASLSSSLQQILFHMLPRVACLYRCVELLVQLGDHLVGGCISIYLRM